MQFLDEADYLTSPVINLRMGARPTEGLLIITAAGVETGRQPVDGVTDAMLGNDQVEHWPRDVEEAPRIKLAYEYISAMVPVSTRGAEKHSELLECDESA